jgi:hypothetical protein
MQKRVPLPFSLSTSMNPPCCITMPYTVESPRPVPRPASLVVKKGSKMCSATDRSMPVPVSLTSSAMNVPARAWGWVLAYSSSRSRRLVSKVRVPLSGMASWAFTARFMRICSTWPASTFASPRAASFRTRIVMFSLSVRLRIFSKPDRMRFRSMGLMSSTCLRLNARSCRVRFLALSAAFWIVER